jgi:hypothetical protein
MADHFNAGKYGAIVPFQFFVDNAVTNQTATDLAPYTGHTLQTMPYSGSVVGIAVGATANVTAGSATFRAHLAGTEFAQQGYPSAVLDATNSNATYASVRPGVMKFTAGQRVGVSYASATDLNPTNTNDFLVTLWVQIDED